MIELIWTVFNYFKKASTPVLDCVQLFSIPLLSFREIWDKYSCHAFFNLVFYWYFWWILLLFVICNDERSLEKIAKKWGTIWNTFSRTRKDQWYHIGKTIIIEPIYFVNLYVYITDKWILVGTLMLIPSLIENRYRSDTFQMVW